MNKKGMELTINTAIVLLLAVLAAGVIVWAVIFKGIIPGATGVSNKLTCAGIIGVGNCKAACDDGEQSFPKSFGCEKNTDGKTTCCISLEKGQSTSNYGGNNDFNFEVQYIDIDSPPAGCVKNQNVAFGYTCTNVGSLKIKIVVYNSGTKDMNIFANPSYTDNNGAATYIAGNPSLVKASAAPATNLVTNTVVLVKGHTYVFTAAAKCTDGLCTSPTSPTGIFRVAVPAQIMTVVAN